MTEEFKSQKRIVEEIIFEEIPFKMESSLSNMLHLFSKKTNEKNIELIKDYDNRIPEVLLGDPMRLHQIILNLMSNAVKFTPKGKITVSIHLLKDDKEKTEIEFKIKDSGIGISENKLQTIFETAEQTSVDTVSLYGGSELGLAIVRQLVEQQGGSIDAKSKLGEGSEFSFKLDFKKVRGEAELQSGIVELDTEGKKIKILAVEIIPMNQTLMQILLNDFGFDCDFAPNGKTAIEKVQTKSYDILLMELQMPEMNGFETANHMRKKLNSKIPIVALGTDLTSDIIAKCQSSGINDYIERPFDEVALYNKIMRVSKRPIPLGYRG